MFRHFAALTLAVTGLLALLATGENREAVELQVEEKREKNELRQKELELAKQGKGGNTSLVFKDNRKQKAAWSIDEGNPETSYATAEGEGSPELIGDTGPKYVDLPGEASGNATRSSVAPPGMTGQALNELRKRKKRLAQKDPTGRRPPPTEDEESAY